MSNEHWQRDAQKIAKILSDAKAIDKTLRVEKVEFQRRQDAVISALRELGLQAAIVYSDEHYNGDVP